MNSLLHPLMRLLSWFEISPARTLRALKLYPGYLADKRTFAIDSDWEMTNFPCLFDKGNESSALGEYFWQDLFIAGRILEANPARHIDVGSRIDGFIAHLACTRSLEVFDIRPLDTEIPNIKFIQMDICNPVKEFLGVSDLVTCLHSLEHFGLGRYGDPVDTQAWKRGLDGLAGLLKPAGTLWLSVPVGRQRVEFNAHRIFNPCTIVDYAKSLGLILEEFHYFDGSTIQHSTPPENDFPMLSKSEYALGMFHFVNTGQ